MAARYFVRAPYADTVEEFADEAGRYGRLIAIRCFRAHDGSVAGSVEIEAGDEEDGENRFKEGG